MSMNHEMSGENVAEELIKCGRSFYSRGWLYGTSGNLSAVLNINPLDIAITRSGADKGNLSREDILGIDSEMKVISGKGVPSSETLLHITTIKVLKAGAVFHTHSVWSTILSDIYADAGKIELQGYEMLKALKGVRSHDHLEIIPIFENSQDMKSLSEAVKETMMLTKGIHAFLLRGHGLYTWGDTINDARRTVEALEFLLEAKGRIMQFKNIK